MEVFGKFRGVNHTEISFTNTEISLLENGPKYNIHAKERNWIQDLGSSPSYHGFVFSQFGFGGVYQSGFRVCVVFGV